MATHSRTGERRRKRGTAEEIEPSADVNMIAAGLLHDMAALQPNERSQLGYKRAAKAVIALPLTVGDLVAAGTLRDVPYIGPSSARIIIELVETGASSTVDAAVAASRNAGKVASLRQLRTGFLSQLAMEQALALPRDPAVVSKGDFRGDFQMHSTWSDGGERIEAMADGCLALGHTCMGITDHSYGLPIARGISMEDARRQHREIDRLNKRFAGEFRIFKGIEANILAGRRARPAAGGAQRLRVRRGVAAFAAAPRSRSDLAHAARRGGAWRGDPRPSAGPDVQQPGGRQSRLAARLRDGRKARRRDRDRRQLAPAGRSPSVSRARRSRRAASSRSTATRTRSASCASPTTRSRTPASPGSRRSG